MNDEIREQYNMLRVINGNNAAKKSIALARGMSISNINRILRGPLDVEDFISSITFMDPKPSIDSLKAMYTGDQFVHPLKILPTNNKSNNTEPLPKLEQSKLGFYQALCKISIYLAFNSVTSNKSEYNALITSLKRDCNNQELLNKVIQRLVLAFNPYDEGDPHGKNLKHSLFRCYEHEFTPPGERRFDTDDMILGSGGQNITKGRAQAKKFYGDPIWVSEKHSPLQILLKGLLDDSNNKLLMIRKVFMNIMFEISECSPDLFTIRRNELFARLKELNPEIQNSNKNNSKINNSNINSAKIPKRCALFELCIPEMVPVFLDENTSFFYKSVGGPPPPGADPPPPGADPPLKYIDPSGRVKTSTKFNIHDNDGVGDCFYYAIYHCLEDIQETFTSAFTDFFELFEIRDASVSNNVEFTQLLRNTLADKMIANEITTPDLLYNRMFVRRNTTNNLVDESFFQPGVISYAENFKANKNHTNDDKTKFRKYIAEGIRKLQPDCLWADVLVIEEVQKRLRHSDKLQFVIHQQELRGKGVIAGTQSQQVIENITELNIPVINIIQVPQHYKSILCNKPERNFENLGQGNNLEMRPGHNPEGNNRLKINNVNNFIRHHISNKLTGNITKNDVMHALNVGNNPELIEDLQGVEEQTYRNNGNMIFCQKLQKSLREKRNSLHDADVTILNIRENALKKIINATLTSNNNNGNQGNSGQGNNQGIKNAFREKVRQMYPEEVLSNMKLNEYITHTDLTDMQSMNNGQINDTLQQLLSTGGKSIKKSSTKKVRNHQGIVKTGPNNGKLKKGYKYSGKKLKNGLREIVKVK